MSNEQYYTTPREPIRVCMVTARAHGLIGFCETGQIRKTSTIVEILINPYISGQNSAKFGGRKFIDLRKQYRT